MSRGKVGMMASFTLLALSSILLLGAPSAADQGTISNVAGGLDNLDPAAPVIVSATAADDGASVTVLFGRSTDDADGFQAVSDDFTIGGTFVSSNNVAGYWVHQQGRWWYFPVPAGAQPGQLILPDPSMEGPPPGYENGVQPQPMPGAQRVRPRRRVVRPRGRTGVLSPRRGGTIYWY